MERDRDRQQTKGWRRETDRQRQRDTDRKRQRHPQREGNTGVLSIPTPASPDFADILLSHFHVDDDGVYLILDQLPHAPGTQLQQTVFLLKN